MEYDKKGLMVYGANNHHYLHSTVYTTVTQLYTHIYTVHMYVAQAYFQQFYPF